ncbi:DUF3027 domain-containing protein [Arthrobacter sp. ZGTC212]|uniref:DUF3027 domain-containing protein n=1 Tax=Arthrobacter sp. ZGTC212 TaxID=2058899 RepID=UPI000CE3CBDE|nr:DUF3027 domain-containing protein [Arthrobacter sp. ZGTC212]
MSTSATESSETVSAAAAADGTQSPAKAPRRVRRPSKPDAVLAAAVETARAGLLEVVPAEQIGSYIGAFPDAERLVTHRFESLRPGYNGWHWYATVARVPRGKAATVCEVGLLPSEHAVLAPEWLPWSERLRPEDVAAEEAARAAQEREQPDGDGNAADDAAVSAGDGTGQDGAAQEDR